MIIYIDENLSHYLAEGLNSLQKPENLKLKDPIEVKSIANRFQTGAKDEDWIPVVGEQNACVITQDINLQRTRHQRELYMKHNLGVFFFKPPSKRGYSYWEMVELVIKHWKQIVDAALTENKPFSYICTPRNSKLSRLSE